MAQEPSDPLDSSAPQEEDELEAALAALRGEDETPAIQDQENWDQSAIDALLAQEQAEAGDAAAVDDTVRPEDALDAPVTPEAGVFSLSQEELDAVLSGADVDAPLVQSSLDDMINVDDMPAEEPDSGIVGQADLDRLLASAAGNADSGGPEVQLGDDVPQESPDDELSRIFANADHGVQPERPDVGAENLAAAASAESDEVGVSQDLLDALLAEAEGTSVPEPEPTPAPAESDARPQTMHQPEPAPPPQRTQPVTTDERVEAVTPVAKLRPRRNITRLLVSVASGALVFVSALTYFWLNPFQPLGEPEDIAGSRIRPLSHVTRVAQAYIDEGDYAKAVAELEIPLKTARPSQERTEAEYTYLEAATKGLPPDATDEQIDRLHERIESLVERSRANPRAAEALTWKAQLYRRQNLPVAATAVYREIINNYGFSPDMDSVLYDAAANALDMKDYEVAAGYLQRLLTEYPASKLAGPGKLLLGDAYRGAGQPDSARVIYIQVAEAHASGPLGGEGYARLGELAYEEGRYGDAIEQLETRRQMATSTKGNEQVYLLLAKAYRGAGKPAEAEVVLRELIDFFPENPFTPEAYVQLSQVLDDRGMRTEAVRLARRTAMLYPNNPIVLRNEGEILGKAGVFGEAADALVAAETAGAKDPKILLQAAGFYEKAEDLKKASETYEGLLVAYPTSPEAFEGGVALAKVEFDQGQIQKALERLEGLATVTEGKPQRLPILTALARTYGQLGMRDRAAQVYSQIAALTTDPELLATSATALIESGAADEGLQVAGRVEREKLSPETAYLLLMNQGNVLLRIDPERGLGLMEEAYAAYPEQHTPEWNQRLLEAYLTADRSAYARRLVMDIAARAGENPQSMNQLIRAAVAWGDYLYSRQDYRAAADAYALIPSEQTVVSPDVEWAAFQRANAMLQIGDFDGSIKLFDTVAAGNGRWAQDASLKAEYARIEQRLRGQTVTPAGGSGAA